MSEEIAVGDLVMVVRGVPCCGDTRFEPKIGTPGKVIAIHTLGSTSSGPDTWFDCKICGQIHDRETLIVDIGAKYLAFKATLQKFDPPAVGDSLPTRKDLEQPA